MRHIKQKEFFGMLKLCSVKTLYIHVLFQLSPQEVTLIKPQHMTTHIDMFLNHFHNKKFMEGQNSNNIKNETSKQD